jgi:2-polyprenyl-3-methyl-5-hydroxy-6-metoxy-1,4-benzoquinol methylase
MGSVERHRTAIRRVLPSRPITLALEEGLVTAETTVFDYGCGRGVDLLHLQQLGVDAAGWDPAFRADAEKTPADVVNLGYVVNVIEDLAERQAVLRAAWTLAKCVLVVSARLEWEARAVNGSSFADGVLTGAGTFQKFFRQDELRDWIEATLGVKSVAAAPGIFYVFRDETAAHSYLAQRFASSGRGASARVSERLFDANRELLEGLALFVSEHDRLPAEDELSHADELIERFGSIRAAFAVVRQVTGQAPTRSPTVSERLFDANRDLLEQLVTFVAHRGRLPASDEMPNFDELRERFGSIKSAFAVINRVSPQDWQAIRVERQRDLLVYLALAAFGGRPRLGELPRELQYDVKAFFSTYKHACTIADALLFKAGERTSIDQACRQSQIGKRTRDALYAHITALDRLAPLLRVYEGCARVLTGTVAGANIIKLRRDKAQVSYLSYPDFDRDPHPALAEVTTADLPRLRVEHHVFRDSTNPPILHRKDAFVASDYPGRSRFSRLTQQEERSGLLEAPLPIGRRQQWEAWLEAHDVEIRGHRVVKVRGVDSAES